ncbi:hypothetical protein HK096_004695 [Nowakowskiella sp. JEL0078]|nr:hypothetical protein HK096_004695 [Nowakowskiella sp. JEL0078]
MTRIPGTLEAPIESATPAISENGFYKVFHRKHDLTFNQGHFEAVKTDLTLLSYVHPALIGRLPILWLATQGFDYQHLALAEAREEQALRQRDVWKQVVLRQRVAIKELETERQHQFEIAKTSKLSVRKDGGHSASRC